MIETATIEGATLNIEEGQLIIGGIPGMRIDWATHAGGTSRPLAGPDALRLLAPGTVFSAACEGAAPYVFMLIEGSPELRTQLSSNDRLVVLSEGGRIRLKKFDSGAEARAAARHSIRLQAFGSLAEALSSAGRGDLPGA